MSHVYYHCVSTARTFGGQPEDYIELNTWIDAPKEWFGDFRHRAMRHHAHGIFEAERVFGVTLTNSDCKQVPVRGVAEIHLLEDCSFLPTVADWLQHLQPNDWMKKPSKHAYFHAAASSDTFGGKPDDYLKVHAWLEATRESFADDRHRAFRYHSHGVFEGERQLGVTITNSDGQQVCVRTLLEMQINREFDCIPTVADWLDRIQPQPWMARASMVKHQHRARRAHA